MHVLVKVWGIKTTVSLWTVKEGIACTYKSLLYNGIVHFTLIWNASQVHQFCNKGVLVSHDSHTKGNIQAHAGMIHFQNGKCIGQTVDE